MTPSNLTQFNYGTAILSAFEYLLDRYPEVFVIGQGLWSPWYVGNSMTDATIAAAQGCPSHGYNRLESMAKT